MYLITQYGFSEMRCGNEEYIITDYGKMSIQSYQYSGYTVRRLIL